MASGVRFHSRKCDQASLTRGERSIINARWIVEHDGYLTITLPYSVRVEAGQLAAALG